jgi:hypothetical protein
LPTVPGFSRARLDDDVAGAVYGGHRGPSADRRPRNLCRSLVFGRTEEFGEDLVSAYYLRVYRAEASIFADLDETERNQPFKSSSRTARRCLGSATKVRHGDLDVAAKLSGVAEAWAVQKRTCSNAHRLTSIPDENNAAIRTP